MKVIAGLGNPGQEYEGTPHNVGFDVVACLAARRAIVWRPSAKFQARLARVDGVDGGWLLVQPMTFMNLSGASVAPVLRYHNCSLADLVVVVDDADLPMGRLRLRADGGSGGHRGLASVIESLGTELFARVRLGVGRDASSDGLVEHVLGKFDAARLAVARQMTQAAADAVECLTEKGMAEAMNRYNGWQAGTTEPAAGR